MNPLTKRDRLYLAELLRFYESQQHHGKLYLEDTLKIWEENATHGDAWKAYKEAVRQIRG